MALITDACRFGTVAYLKQIWWVEVEGRLEFEFPVGSYSLFFRLQLGEKKNIHIHGWDVKPVTFQLESSNSGHAFAKSQRFFNHQGKWLYHHVGDFLVHNSTIATSLKFSMTQIDCTHTKAGLCVDSVFVFPTNHL
ncbi:phloem protein 2-A13 [Perilla frutescens var. hirtella]|uniref:Phloem protein 2-A13 n=1 Tax=Perilla frutescens var. hirtella TaxID=608512 RepID=A0AAD4JMS3_PERFH|nr:phloem protein 2-A13 [Perilla frutescens var. hirtella]KAH6835878.1 phloem protein 2-A13 [Perilla frutescens var. hirtella]